MLHVLSAIGGVIHPPLRRLLETLSLLRPAFDALLVQGRGNPFTDLTVRVDQLLSRLPLKR